MTSLLERVRYRLGLDASTLTGELVRNRLHEEPRLVPLYESMSDEEAHLHFGADEPIDAPHLRAVVRLFHAWRVELLRERLGERLGDARVLDVGDTDGLILKALGKTGTGFNLSPAAVRRIEENGVEAVLGDGHGLPFEDGAFDVVLCFEMLEHVEAPAQVIDELARVCNADGRVLVTVPWVPRTFVHPRHPDAPRGAMHIFEFDRHDFLALVSHTRLEHVWDTVCDVVGGPRTPAQAIFAATTRRDHIVGGTFRRFQFFELRPRRA